MQRLLIAASGRREANHPQSLGKCLAEAERMLSATARHLRVSLVWHMDDALYQFEVADGPSLHAAVTNLVLNAIQAASEVVVTVHCAEDHVVIKVVDDGKGPPSSVADEIFQPFVTSKPEGLGLGLPLVAESAKRLGGEVSWDRENDHTRFTMSAQVTLLPDMRADDDRWEGANGSGTPSKT
jgi:signal transduction histidine kinase